MLLPASNDIDVDRLARDLRDAVRGGVRFDDGARALYATDASNYRLPPIGVVIPRETEDLVRGLEVCRRHGAPVLARGGGTSLAGQCCNTAVLFDVSKYLNRVLAIDPARRVARVQPGTILDDLRTRARRYGLTFGPDPSTHNHCTLGGMVGNDSCGVHSVMAQFAGRGARTADNIESLEVVTYDGTRMRVGPTSEAELDAIIARGGRQGEIYAGLRALRDRHAEAIRTGFPQIPRRVSGYNLPYLLPENGFNVARALAGTEGTCALVLEIEAGLIPEPARRVLLLIGYPDIFSAADHVPEIMAHRPIGLEAIDDRLVHDMLRAGLHPRSTRLLPDGRGWLLAEFGGDTAAQAADHAHDLMRALAAKANAPSMSLIEDDAEAAKIWEIRESGLGATARVASDHPTWPGWEDSAVAPERLGEYLRRLRVLLDAHGYNGDFYGHFGQGCLHIRINFDLTSDAGIRRYRHFVEAAADLVSELGGSLSGEHGDGQARAELLPRMFSAEIIDAFRTFKRIWDPDWKMNPGKVVDPEPLDAHLRLGRDYDPPVVTTTFQYPDDEGSFAKAASRCVGVGECRRLDGGTMCPSFMVTREEMHSTRGRARLLFEMLRGDPLTDGWQSEPVREALDLCFACKGCRSDCPVKVDMATYKAEFLSHYYERHRRPAAAYAFGLVSYWARAASTMPRLANLATHLPGLRTLIKGVVGMTSERDVPAFAAEPFTTWFGRRRLARRPDKPRVILWPDTFNNYFHPETAKNAVRVLEHAGFQVELPPRPVCCGRPLYDYGMLETAKAWLEDILEMLGPAIDAGVPIVGLEPSCVAVFRDELRGLLPQRERARRLGAQTYMLGEFLQAQPGYRSPRLERRALLHGHCHHKAVLHFESDEDALTAAGLQVQVLDAGCCGLAGSFGFERDHYEVSVRAGERVLAPAIRRAPADTLIVADGFSCREQIRHLTDRRALHLADVLAMALDEGPIGPAGDYPERDYVVDHARNADAAVVPTLAAAGLVLAAAGAFMWLRHRHPTPNAESPTPKAAERLTSNA